MNDFICNSIQWALSVKTDVFKTLSRSLFSPETTLYLSIKSNFGTTVLNLYLWLNKLKSLSILSCSSHFLKQDKKIKKNKKNKK